MFFLRLGNSYRKAMGDSRCVGDKSRTVAGFCQVSDSTLFFDQRYCSSTSAEIAAMVSGSSALILLAI